MMGPLRRIGLATLLLLASPAVCAASAGGVGGPGGGGTSLLPGVSEWQRSRGDAAPLLRELEADPVRAKAARRLETEWQALDRVMQKVRTLQAQGKLDAKTAHASADELEVQMRRVESAAEDVRNARDQARTRFQATDQKVSQLMNLLTTITKAINEMRGIGAASRSGL
jgi:uncharacterized protein YjgD (DUF1641 family)